MERKDFGIALTPGRVRRQGYEAAKRCVDVALALAALIVTLPLWAAAAAIICVSSPGPIFFVQRRIGRWQQPFRLIKFRTMHAPRLADSDNTVTIVDDPRIFRGGAWLRRWKIDELPQLLNVLAGSMSLVGPRPTVQSDYDRMSPSQQRRATVPPGLTGLAQIRGGASVPWPARLRWDLRYIEQRNLRLDMNIVAETAWLVLSGRAPGESASGDEWMEAEPAEL